MAAAVAVAAVVAVAFAAVGVADSAAQAAAAADSAVARQAAALPAAEAQAATRNAPAYHAAGPAGHGGPAGHQFAYGHRPAYHGGWYHGDWHGGWGHPWGYRPFGWYWGGGWGWGLGWGLGFGLGTGLGLGVTLGSPWGWGYYPYWNPYWAQPVGVPYYINYSQPIVVAPPAVPGQQGAPPALRRGAWARADSARPAPAAGGEFARGARPNERAATGLGHLRPRSLALQARRLPDGAGGGESRHRARAQRYDHARVPRLVPVRHERLSTGRRRGVCRAVDRPRLGLGHGQRVV